jgi:hypothetical protein
MIGCGYCLYEKECHVHNPNVNKASFGCPGFRHFDDAPISNVNFPKEEVSNFNDRLNEKN